MQMTLTNKHIKKWVSSEFKGLAKMPNVHHGTENASKFEKFT